MNVPRKLLAAVLALAGLSFACSARAQNDVSLVVTSSPSPVLINNPLLFTIVVSNTSGFILNNVFVTNVFSGSAVFNGATNSPNHTGPAPVELGGSIIFQINQLPATGPFNSATLRLNLSPENAGPFTNRVSAKALLNTNVVTTELVTQVTPPSTDLAVGMTSVASGVLVNDQTSIGLSVTNLGPISATGVVLSNTLPASFQLLSISPTNSHTLTNGNLVLALGTLTNGATRHFQVTVQPTNAVTNFNVIAAVFSPNVQDTNTANSVVTNVMSVGDILSTNLTVTELSQQFNPQTGLREMQVQLSNTGTNDVPAARVIVSGLTNGTRLYNAIGTNSGNAYVLYNNTLTNGTSVNLLLEFYVLDRGPLTNRTLSAIGVPALTLNTPTSSGVVITNHVMSSGGFLIEFAATPGKTYTIVYAGDTSFSNAFTAQPSIVAPANRVQWIDNGPPKTISHPSNTTSRVYRVFQSP